MIQFRNQLQVSLRNSEPQRTFLLSSISLPIVSILNGLHLLPIEHSSFNLDHVRRNYPVISLSSRPG